MTGDDTDEDVPLAHAIVHLNQRLNQALSEAIEYEQTGREPARFAALAELEAVQEEITDFLDDAETDDL